MNEAVTTPADKAANTNHIALIAMIMLLAVAMIGGFAAMITAF